MLKITTTKRVEYFVNATDAIGITLRRPLYGEGPAILGAVLESLQPLVAAEQEEAQPGKPVPEGATDDEKARIESANLLASLPFSIANARAQAEAAKAIPHDLVERVFTEYVVSVDGVEDVTTGADLLAIADLRLVRFVLDGLYGLCRLKVTEGKGSASPSTSDAAAPATDVSPSPAPSIESEAGAAPSTATQTTAP